MNCYNRAHTHTVGAHDGRTALDHVIEGIHTSPVWLENDGLLQTYNPSLSAVNPPKDHVKFFKDKHSNHAWLSNIFEAG